MVGRVESIRNFLLHGSKNNVENEQPTSHASQQGPPPLTQGNLLNGIDNKTVKRKGFRRMHLLFIFMFVPLHQ